MGEHTIRLIVTLYLAGSPHPYTRPVPFHTWHDCALAGEAMVSHSRRVATGAVGFQCFSLGGRDGR